MSWSGQERIAYNTGYQDGIYGRAKVNPYDEGGATRKSWFAYEEGYSDGEGSTTPPRGPAGPVGPEGPAGQDGAAGPVGNPGEDGQSTLTGNGTPSGGLGEVGDTYIDWATGDFYEKTGISTWTFRGRLGDVTLAVQLDDTGGSPNVLYKGEANPGTANSSALWRIQRITITTDVGGNDDVTIEWASGSASFNQVWDDRASLSYS